MFFVIYRGQTDKTAKIHKTKSEKGKTKTPFLSDSTKRLKQINGSTRRAPLHFAIENLPATRTVGKVPIENVEANLVVSSNLSGDG